MWPALALALLAQAPLRLEIRGNLALPEGVYRSALTLPAAPPTLDKVNALVKATESFLLGAGYALASVDGYLLDEAIVLTVHEGQLEKVVFRGRLTYQMVRLKLALDVPYDVYNRPAIQRQIKHLCAQLGIVEPRLELVPTHVVQHSGPQMDSLGELGTILGATLLRPRQQYELHVVFPETQWGDGVGLDLRVTALDGLELGVNYQGSSLLLADDRWRVGVMGGVGVRTYSGSPLYPSRLFLEAQWYTPPFFSVRSFLWLKAEGLARQRPDLQLENYLTVETELSANLEARPFRPVRLFLGLGLQQFLLFGQRAPTDLMVLPPAGPDEQRWRGFAQLGVELVFETGNARWDRRHALELQGRLWNNLSSPARVNFTELRLWWQKVVSFGWHDLWLIGRGAWLSGEVLYPFEQSLSEDLRAVFGNVFVRAVGGGTVEFRYSLSRDVFKLGVFLDGAAYGELQRATGTQTPRLGLAVGPSFHALIEGMFQVNLALSFGVATGTQTIGVGVYATVLKVF
jgi:hypothetical protein